MLDRMRARASDESGFTLIELLVVILIIGILAAIAIPAFLSQTSKAYDSSAKTLAQTAQTAAETYGTENGGLYTGLSAEALHKVEPTISASNSTASGPAVTAVEVPTGGKSYKITIGAQKTKDTFSIERTEGGETVRTCEQKEASGTSGCKVEGSGKTGTW
ncbi:MAG: type II secretion system protein [Solirubrobacteraceae bacterium]